MNRRQFLQATGLALISGKLLSDELIKWHNKSLIERIYYELPNHVHEINAWATISKEDSIDKIIVQSGYGIIKNNEFWTMAHIVNFDRVKEFGWDIVSKGYKLYKRNLEEKVIDKPNDIAIFKLPPEFKRADYPEFPCDLIDKYHLGDDVFIIGAPRLAGFNIRRGHISDLDKINDVPQTRNCFGVDLSVNPGDSGSPVVGKDFKLLGLASYHCGDDLSYIKKIKEYTD